jgi:lysyl-tRNA synthetase class 2
MGGESRGINFFMRRRLLFDFTQLLREFFIKEQFLETLTPPMVQNPGMETHIHPFKVFKAKSDEPTSLYLHTSPEFAMKELISSYQEEKLTKIYNLGYVFRDEPLSLIHRTQFLMLEWYQINQPYEAIMLDLEKMISFLIPKMKTRTHLRDEKIKIISMKDLFFQILNFNLDNFLDEKELEEKIKKDYKDIPLPKESLSFEDLFYLLFLNKIENHLINFPLLIIKEFPAQLAALSELKKDTPHYCHRFEFFINGVEIANCFQELTNQEEQKKRFEAQAKSKKLLYGYDLPVPHDFYQSLEKGLPSCSGIALGVERLLMGITGEKNVFFN